MQFSQIRNKSDVFSPVKAEEPFCCEIDQLVFENTVSCFGFTFSGVPTGQMSGLCGRAQEVLVGLADGKQELDIKRMHTIIKNQMLQIVNQVRVSVLSWGVLGVLKQFSAHTR